MTGFKSKQAAAQAKLNEDDDIQDYKKPWVGLTEEDKFKILQHKWWDFEDEFDLDGLLKLVEATLKQKNT